MKTYLDADLAQMVARLAASQNRSESSVIADAVRTRFAAASEAAAAAAGESQKRQLSRLEQRVDKLVWEATQTKQMMMLFVRVWLEHNPPLEPELEDSAAASAEARFERFLDLFVQRLAEPFAFDLFDRPDRDETRLTSPGGLQGDDSGAVA